MAQNKTRRQQERDLKKVNLAGFNDELKKRGFATRLNAEGGQLIVTSNTGRNWLLWGGAAWYCPALKKGGQGLISLVLAIREDDRERLTEKVWTNKANDARTQLTGNPKSKPPIKGRSLEGDWLPNELEKQQNINCRCVPKEHSEIIENNLKPKYFTEFVLSFLLGAGFGFVLFFIYVIFFS